MRRAPSFFSSASAPLATLASSSLSGLRTLRPPASHRDQIVAVFRPIMECFGIEISAIGPLDRSERGVELDGVKQRNVLEWSEHLSFQDGTEIDPLLTVVVEPKRQRVRADDHEVRDAVDGMTHDVSSMLVQWLDLDRWPAGLQERPVLQQFFPMDFCP